MSYMDLLDNLNRKYWGLGNGINNNNFKQMVPYGSNNTLASVGLNRMSRPRRSGVQGGAQSPANAAGTAGFGGTIQLYKKRKRFRRNGRKQRRMRRWRARVQKIVYKNVVAEKQKFIIDSLYSTTAVNQQGLSIFTGYSTTDLIDLFNDYTSDETVRVYIKSLVWDLTFTNKSTVPMVFDIYEAYCKKPIPATEGSLTTMFSQGVSDQAQAGVTLELPGLSPYTLGRITEYFKIVRKTRIILEGGHVQNIERRFRRGRRFNGQELATDISSGATVPTTTMLKGSYAMFVFQYGTPVKQNAANSIGLGATAAAFVRKAQYHYSIAEISTTDTWVTNNLPAITVPSVVNPDTSEVDTYAVAP